MADEFEQIVLNVAQKAAEQVRGDGINDRTYQQTMSRILSDDDLFHEPHKKIFDERKGKYRFIDLYFPDQKKFVKLRSKKFITRTEINELKDDEHVTGMHGIIINFYDGVASIRHSYSSRSHGRSVDFMPKIASEYQPGRKKKHLPHISASTGTLNELSERSLRPQLYRYHKFPMSPSVGISEPANSNKIFALSCAAFFLSDGGRKEFVDIFNNLLKKENLEKIDVPEVFLEGPKMKTPELDVSHVLEKALSGRFKRLSLGDKSNSGSSKKSEINGDFIENGEAIRLPSSAISKETVSL